MLGLRVACRRWLRWVRLTLVAVAGALTLITGFFGMNVRFPGYLSATAFWAILGGMVVSLIGLIGFFRYKRWL